MLSRAASDYFWVPPHTYLQLRNQVFMFLPWTCTERKWVFGFQLPHTFCYQPGWLIWCSDWLRARRPRKRISISEMDKRYFSKNVQTDWSPSTLVLNTYCDCFPRDKAVETRNYFPSLSDEVKMLWAPPYAFMEWCLIKHGCDLTWLYLHASSCVLVPCGCF